MSPTSKLQILAAVTLSLVTCGSAHAADARGCRDVEGIGRFQGSSLVMCANKEFAEYTLPTGPMEKFNFDTGKATFKQQISLEGRLVENVYAVPSGASSAQVFRNFRQLLQSTGYSILYEGKQSELGENFGSYFETVGPGTQLFGYSPDEARYLAATRDDNGAKTYVGIYVIEYADGYDRNFEAIAGQVLVRLDFIVAGNLNSQMAVVAANEIERRFQTDGRVDIYGIYFDFNSATLRPESWPALDQIAAYLTAHPERGMTVIGHTDNIGGPDFNLSLSQARSASVVAALVSRYGISPGRLAELGAGLTRPVAPNDTEEGRARNRRVELVPR